MLLDRIDLLSLAGFLGWVKLSTGEERTGETTYWICIYGRLQI